MTRTFHLAFVSFSFFLSILDASTLSYIRSSPKLHRPLFSHRHSRFHHRTLTTQPKASSSSSSSPNINNIIPTPARHAYASPRFRSRLRSNQVTTDELIGTLTNAFVDVDLMTFQSARILSDLVFKASDQRVPIRSLLYEFQKPFFLKSMVVEMMTEMIWRPDIRTLRRLGKLVRLWYVYFPDHSDHIHLLNERFISHMVNKGMVKEVAFFLHDMVEGSISNVYLLDDSAVHRADYVTGLLPKPHRGGTSSHPLIKHRKETILLHRNLIEGLLDGVLKSMVDLDLTGRTELLHRLYTVLTKNGFRIEERLHIDDDTKQDASASVFRLEWVYDGLKETGYAFPIRRVYFPETSEYKITKNVESLVSRFPQPDSSLDLDALFQFDD